MPDFGWWSWDMPALGAIDDVADEAVRRERLEPWDAKKQKLVWRGKLNFAPKLRRALVEAAKGKSWSDVGQVKWEDTEFKEPGAHFLGPVDQCSYMFIAHAEGTTRSALLRRHTHTDRHRTLLLRCPQVSPALPLRHCLSQAAVDPALPLPAARLGRQTELCRGRARLLRSILRHGRSPGPSREGKAYCRQQRQDLPRKVPDWCRRGLLLARTGKSVERSQLRAFLVRTDRRRPERETEKRRAIRNVHVRLPSHHADRC